MKTIIATSDFHGFLPQIDNEFDLLFICGDIVPLNIQRNITISYEWLSNDFAEWINNLQFKDVESKVVITWGNHDFIGESITNEMILKLYEKTNNRLIILNHEYIEIHGLKIFGTPYCKEFFNWAFMLPDDKLDSKYSEIPNDLNVLISHDSPSIDEYGTIHEGFNEGLNVGNVPLANLIKEKKPSMSFFGHIHSHDHKLRMVNGTWMAGVSLLNEYYYEAFKPLVINYDENKKTVIL